MNSETVVHENPVWREQANFIVVARINAEPSVTQWQWEQLWARQVDNNRFIICCIPFFIYNLALGDEVETGLQGETRYVIRRRVKSSGHYTFRVWFQDSRVREEVAGELERMGCLMEWRWSTGKLLAIDAASDSIAEKATKFLWDREQLGQLEYETGRI